MPKEVALLGAGVAVTVFSDCPAAGIGLHVEIAALNMLFRLPCFEGGLAPKERQHKVGHLQGSLGAADVYPLLQVGDE